MSLKKPASDQQMKIYTAQKEITIFKSRYDFLGAHKGIRPNCLHGLMGTMGSGKSTLFKCIIVEAAKHKKILVWLSEETVIEYQDLISYLDKSVLENIVFIEEKELPQNIRENQTKFFAYFEQMTEQSECELVFIDNVTTSVFYNMSFGLTGQGRTASFLTNFVKNRCSVFYACHTETGIQDNHNKVVAPENMRGSKELAIMTEYFYIMQKFTTNDKIYVVLRVAKFRHHKEAAGWYALTFEHSAYVKDVKVPFELINKIFKSRDYLGRAAPKISKLPEETPQRKMDIIKDDF